MEENELWRKPSTGLGDPGPFSTGASDCTPSQPGNKCKGFGKLSVQPFKPQAGFGPWALQTTVSQKVTRDVWARELWVLNTKLVNCDISWPTLHTPLLVLSAQTSATFAQVTYSQSSSIWSNPAKHRLVKIRDLQRVFSLWRRPACLEWLCQ